MKQPSWSGTQPGPNRGNHSVGSPGNFTHVDGAGPFARIASTRSTVGSLSTKRSYSKSLRVATYQPPSTRSGRGVSRDHAHPSTQPSTYSLTDHSPMRPSDHCR